MPAALLAVLRFIAIDGKIARDPAKIGTQDGRVGRRHRVPCAKPGIVDAFLAVLHVVQNVLRDAGAIRAVFGIRLYDCLFVSLIIQFDDQLILHVRAPFIVSLPYKTTFLSDPDRFLKNSYNFIPPTAKSRWRGSFYIRLNVG